MMKKGRPQRIGMLSPKLQVAFYYRLQTIRRRCLDHALQRAVAAVNLESLDAELASRVPREALQRVAAAGLRGEVFFATPCLLRADPHLLGYYRLLLGYSQKEFYNKGPFGRFRRMEESGDIATRIDGEVEALCASLTDAACTLVEEIDVLSMDTIHDLQLLTLGPQLRGEENTRIGQKATKELFELLRRICGPYVRESTARTIRIENDSKRPVLIEFSSDPDISITEKLPSGVRSILSIEIKGGGDVSNIHNRLGEAEKSHLKARSHGFYEFWTITRVDIDMDAAKRASPTTSRFFHLDRVGDPKTPDHRDFVEAVSALLGIAIGPGTG